LKNFLARLARIFAEMGRATDAQKRGRGRLIKWAGVALGLWMVFGGGHGLVALGQSWTENFLLKREIVSLQRENRELELRQQDLQRDRAYYEKVAREKLFLKNPGDLIYRFDRN
jgi:cell division protein FtsB